MGTLYQSTSAGFDITSTPSVEVETKTYTLDDALEHIGFGKYQLKVILIAGLSWMAEAMEIMVLSILSPTLMCEWHLSRAQEAMVTTIVFIGQGLGSVAWGYASDVYGRKRILLVSTTLVLYFGLLSSQSPSYPWILFLRFVVGFGVGGAAQAVVIVTEIMPINTRGRTVICLTFFYAFGGVSVTSIAIGVMRELNWHWYLLITTTPMLLFLVCGYWLPRSPRYMLTTGAYEDVVQLLKSIANENGKTLPEGTLVAGELSKNRGNVMEMFQNRCWKTSALLFFIWFTSAFCYFGIILVSTEIIHTGINSCHALVKDGTKAVGQCMELTKKDYINIMVSSVSEFPGFMVAFVLIELVGRKKSLAMQLGSASVGFLLLAICTGRTASLVIIFAVRGLAAGSFLTALVYTPEVLPTNIRAVGLGVCRMFSKVGSMITPFVAQVLIRQSFYLVIGVYLAPMLLCVGASLLLKVETAGKVLQDLVKNDEVHRSDGYQSFDEE